MRFLRLPLGSRQQQQENAEERKRIERQHQDLRAMVSALDEEKTEQQKTRRKQEEHYAKETIFWCKQSRVGKTLNWITGKALCLCFR
jgi:hypothetical protein